MHIEWPQLSEHDVLSLEHLLISSQVQAKANDTANVENLKLKLKMLHIFSSSGSICGERSGGNILDQ